MATPHTAFRLTSERLAKLDELGRLLCPASPLDRTKVVNVLIDQRYEIETRRTNAKPRAGKPAAGGE